MSPAAFSNIRRSLRRRGAKRQRRISAILRGYTHRDPTGPTLGELSQAFDTRAYGAFFILLGGLNLIPLPPGASLLFGIPLMLFALQLAIGRHRLWLPDRVHRIRLSADTLGMGMRKIGPTLRWIERLARHRYWPEPEWVLLVAVGWFCFLMAALVALPFPLTNMAPGVAVALAGVAITARDGLWLIASIVLGLASGLVLAGVYGAAALAVMQIF
ncbi:MAG TPA: exopolysaccharide biosynthesis protein [Aurantimonas sp.]